MPQSRSASALRVAAMISIVIALLVAGTLIAIGVYHVAHQTPQERLAATHDEELDGAFPLRAIVFDSRRGVVQDVEPLAARFVQRPTPVAAQKAGDTQYVLLLHGLKSTAELWLPTVERWMQRSTVDTVFIMPDLLGHGKSAWPLSVRHDPAHHVASLRALLERLVPSGANLHIAGHSLGAMLSLELASNLLQFSPDSAPAWTLKTLSLMAAPYYRSEAEAREAAHRHSFWFRHQWISHLCCGYLLCRQHWLWKHALRRKFKTLYPRLPHSVFAAALQHSHHGIDSCIRHSVLEHRADKAAEQVRAHGVPTLLIDADGDQLCQTSRLTLAHDLAPFCTAVLLRNATHSFVAHRIEDVVRHLRSFVEASLSIAKMHAESTERDEENQKKKIAPTLVEPVEVAAYSQQTNRNYDV